MLLPIKTQPFSNKGRRQASIILILLVIMKQFIAKIINLRLYEIIITVFTPIELHQRLEISSKLKLSCKGQIHHQMSFPNWEIHFYRRRRLI